MGDGRFEELVRFDDLVDVRPTCPCNQCGIDEAETIGQINFSSGDINEEAGGTNLLCTHFSARVYHLYCKIRILKCRGDVIGSLTAKSKVCERERAFGAKLLGLVPPATNFRVNIRRLRERHEVEGMSFIRIQQRPDDVWRHCAMNAPKEVF